MSQSPKKRYESPIKEKPLPTTASQPSDTQSKKYSVLGGDISHLAPDGIVVNKQVPNLGLLEDEDQMDEENQAGRVQMDLFRRILQMAKSKKLAALSGLIGAFMIHLVVGAIYRWNMISYYVGIRYDDQVWAPIGAPLFMLTCGLTMRLGWVLSNRNGSIPVLGVALGAAVVSSFASSDMPTLFYFLIFNNVIYGLAAGLMFLPPLQQCHKFFPSLKLITNTIVLTGTGLGAVLFGALDIECITASHANQEMTDEKLQKYVLDDFSHCTFRSTFFNLGIGLIGILLMIPMIRRNQQKDSKQRIIDQNIPTYCQTEKQAFRSRVFWSVAIMIFLISSGNFYVIMNVRNLVTPQDQNDKVFLYWALIAGAMGNGFSRILWGFTQSRVGFKILFSVIVLLNLSSFIVIIMWQYQAVYIIFYTLNSVSLGGLMVLIPNISLLIFGRKIGESIYSYYWLVFSLANFFQFFITLIITQEPQTNHDYNDVLIVFCVLVGLSFIICALQTLRGEWNNSLELLEFKVKAKKIK